MATSSFVGLIEIPRKSPLEAVLRGVPCSYSFIGYLRRGVKENSSRTKHISGTHSCNQTITKVVRRYSRYLLDCSVKTMEMANVNEKKTTAILFEGYCNESTFHVLNSHLAWICSKTSYRRYVNSLVVKRLLSRDR